MGCVRAILAANDVDVNYPFTLGSATALLYRRIESDRQIADDFHKPGRVWKTALGVASERCCNFAYIGNSRNQDGRETGRCRFSDATSPHRDGVAESGRVHYERFAATVRLLASHPAVHINRRHMGTFGAAGYARDLTPLHFCCEVGDASLAKHLLLAGACRHARDSKGDTPMERAETFFEELINRKPWEFKCGCHGQMDDRGHFTPHEAKGSVGDPVLIDCHELPAARNSHVAKVEAAFMELRAVFSSGVDYWSLREHGGHASATKEVVKTLLLVDQRLDTVAARLPPGTPAALPYLPKDLWLAAIGFLRSADFGPARVWSRETK